jgi:glucose/arabinose dehydrogenase
MRILPAAVLAVALVAGCAGAAAAPPETTVSTALTGIGAGLKGPSGLVATTYATGLANVSAFAFDDAGRLWAATASFADDGTDAVYLIPGAGATPIKTIDDVHTPLGLVWDGGSLYVSSGDGIVAHEDFNALAFGSERTVLALPAGVGQVNGLVKAPDGRLYIGVSAPCDACDPTIEDAAAVLSVRPDGSDLHIVAKHIRAPVGLALLTGTNDLFVTMNQRDDLGDATPGDWLSVVRDGQDWGSPACYGQAGDVCEGVPDPVAELDTHAAVSGVALVSGELGADVGTAALVAEWATGVVLRVPLPDGAATTGATAAPFLTGLERPVPIALSPEGSVTVGDWATGTVYLIRSRSV